MKQLTNAQYAEALRRMFQFVDQTIVPTPSGERKANERAAREAIEEEKKKRG